MQYGTVRYTTEDGYTVFDVFILTDLYIFQAELTYLTEQSSVYSMYDAYLENSFVVNELSQGWSKHSCVECSFPHWPENYYKVVARYEEIMEVVKRMDREEK